MGVSPVFAVALMSAPCSRSSDTDSTGAVCDAAASLVAFFLPMHTATRLALPMIDRVRAINPAATICAYGLYAPLNEAILREHGVSMILGPEAEEDLVSLAGGIGGTNVPHSRQIPRLNFIAPDRSGLPSLDYYASLQMPDGTTKIVGAPDGSGGCKHRCRHCPGRAAAVAQT